jgi:hypothetical protein
VKYLTPHLDEFGFNAVGLENLEDLIDESDGIAVGTRTAVEGDDFHGGLLLTKLYGV